MKITRRQIRQIIREAMDVISGDEILIIPPGSSWGTTHVQVVEALPKTLLVRDEAGYEFEISYNDVVASFDRGDKSIGKFNPAVRESRDSYGRLDTHNMDPNRAWELVSILEEFGYSLHLPPALDSNNIAIDDALAGYPGEFTYDELMTAVRVAQGRGA